MQKILISQAINGVHSRVLTIVERATAKNLWAWLFFALFMLGTISLWHGMFFIDDRGAIVASSANLWSDWVVHLTYTNTLADWPIGYWLSHNPFVIGAHFRYPPLANVPSAILVVLGMPATLAMSLTSFLFFVLLVITLFLLFKRMYRSWNWAGAGVALFLFNGGMGFWYVLTGDESSATNLKSLGIVIQNFVISGLVPQRAILFAAPFFVYCLCLLKDLIDTSEQAQNHRKLIWIAVFSNIILLSSVHTYLALVIVCALVAAQTHKFWQRWLRLAIYCGVSNLILYLLVYGGNDTTGFIKFAPLQLVEFSQLGFWQHFFLNYGLLLPLWFVALLKLRLWKQPLLMAGAGLFLVVYFVQFQPWIWDNTKILTWAYLLVVAPVPLLLKHAWEHKICWLKGLCLLGVISFTASGAHDVWLIAKPESKNWVMFTAEEIRLAQRFAAISDHTDITVTHTDHRNWVHALAARPVYKAFSGWLWTWGLDSTALDRNNQRMLQGDLNLIREKHVRFIVVKRRYQPNKVNQGFLKTLNLVINSANYRVYEVPAQSNR